VISPTTWREIASGRRRDATAQLLRAALAAASLPYGWAVGARNRRYDRGAAEIVRAGVPVVSVGNLTVGGTGKTPLVEWLARRAVDRGVNVALLSRGYRAVNGGANDEARELALALPIVPHLQNPDRAAAAAVAVTQHAARLLVLDDGFQHRRLARDLDIVLVDASEPFGFERLLPRGTLREPVESLRRAGVVVLSRADMLDASGRQAVQRRARQLAPQAAWCEVIHRPAALVDARGQRYALDHLAGRRVAAFCGIGNPAGFRHTLGGLGCQVAAWREFPDHHRYTAADAESLTQWAEQAGAEMVVCTRKDLVKLEVEAVGATPLRAVAVELQFLEGQPAMEAALEPHLRAALQRAADPS